MIPNPVATAGTCGSANATAPAAMVEKSSGQSRLSSVRLGLTSGRDACDRAPASSVAICGALAARRPSQPPMNAATTHHVAATDTSVSSELPDAPNTATAASALAEAALISTVARRRSVNRTASAVGRERRQQVSHPIGSVHDDVRLLEQLGRPLIRAHPDADRGRETALLDE